MDPVGPWSAYASYNRLAGVQAGSGSAELHHPLATPGSSGAPPTTTAQILPGGFLSPSAVGYETVFSPLFHHAAGTKPTAHYVSQHRALAQAAKQTDSDYHQAQAFFEQGPGAWQQNSPFGILPHESVVPTTAGKSYENFNVHFAAAQSLNHLNSQLAAKNIAVSTRAQSPQVVATTTTKTSSPVTFFQGPSSASFAGEGSLTKTFTSNSSNVQQPQTCIVSSASNTNTPPVVTKEYRVPQVPPSARLFLPSANLQPRPIKQPTPQTHIQTKAQTKIYPELNSQTQERPRNNEEPHNPSQSSPISFSLMDTSGRLSYPNNSTAKRTQFQHSPYRQYGAEQDFQRPKSGSDYTAPNGPDCGVVVPRRASPLQAHSQASPLGHAPSPAYPMYNSPMNSISSPQQSTPASPLDVTIPRPATQPGNIVYPSVITRTLNTDKNFSGDRFERPQPQNNQNCWDERQGIRKFQAQTNNYSTGTNVDIQPRTEQGAQRVTNLLTERQQSYFDSNPSHQITLHDLSSCRGDPMSLVKNIQQQQQSCQVVDVKQEVKTPTKRRKSGEKTAATEIPGRIPPPAHSTASGNQQQAPQQQQNGGYFDFDRWNLPPPGPKMFPGQGIHPQHQGLMVPHHHAAPSLPYFTPFHLPPHPEFTAPVELPPVGGSYEQQGTNQGHYQQPQPPEEQPKVVVPNIEEELNYLSQANTPNPTRSAPMNKSLALKPADKACGPGSDFMGSYLKFLQGERDTSPPLTTRGTRKQTSWARAAKPPVPEEKPDSNGIAHVAPPPPPVPVQRLSQGDPQDDPRYFPLPKERKRNSFDSDSDGMSSEDDFFSHKNIVADKEEKRERNGKRGRAQKGSGDKKRQKKTVKVKHKDNSTKLDIEIAPRRESSKRAAKDKSNLSHIMKSGDDDLEEPPEFQDSDSDPAWTPLAKDEGEDIIPVSSKKGKKGATRKRKNIISAAARSAGLTENDILDNEHSRKSKSSSKNKHNTPPTLEDNIAAAIPHNSVGFNDENSFKPGEFVVIKSELCQDWPTIWRVDGKNLLQKYEPFEQNGVTLYRNISTYTSWTPESKKQYMAIPIGYKSQNQLETIVEFLRHELTMIDNEFQERCMKDYELYQDNFEVYIQTLISQALDSNFLTEIFQEKDEYFLSNVKTIDEITDEKKKKLLAILRWPPALQAAVCTWPCFNITRELNPSDAQCRYCAACGKMEIAVRVLMYGQPYNSTTLEGCQPDPKAMNEKNFLMCKICAVRVQLSNKVTHQKYLMYIECAKRVAEKRASDTTKDTTCILNELLADEDWLNQLFLNVRTSWTEIECLEHSMRSRNNAVYT